MSTPADHAANSPTSTVLWRDLVPLTNREKISELFLSTPWLLASLYCYQSGHLVLGAACSFYVFLTGLRQSHGAQHYSLGFPKLFQDAFMFVLSLCMLGSMHAVQTTHVHHHRHCLDEHDSEGWTARLKWWEAIAVGPLFLLRLHLSAWQLATSTKRRWIFAELAGIAGVVLAAISMPGLRGLQWHVLAMLTGECLTGFFAVWTVHHGCDPHHTLARTQRGRCVNWLGCSMFYHAEHHLFPQVPTCHLGILAARLDEADSRFAHQQVIEVNTHRRPSPNAV